jgi:hypothetical protein
MSLATLLLALIGVTTLLAFGVRGNARRRVAIAYGLGLSLSLGGCGGALAWLGAETSGSKNVFHRVDPQLWTALFAAGIAVLVGTSVTVFFLRARQPGTAR